jgi:hypothetical protein
MSLNVSSGHVSGIWFATIRCLGDRNSAMNGHTAGQTSVALDEVLITSALSRRAPRPSNHQAENQALYRLARQMEEAIGNGRNYSRT